MDFKLRQVAALMALGLSCHAFAGTYEPPVCTAQPVTIPCDRTGWDLAFEAFYVEAMNDDLWYANIRQEDSNFITETQTETIRQFFVDHDFDWGFRLEGSYHFNTGNDLTVHWIYYNQGEQNHIGVDAGSNQTIQLRFDGTRLLALPRDGGNTNNNTNILSAYRPDEAKVDSQFDFDAIRAEMGQHVDVGNDVDLRFHYGLEYAHINHGTDSYLLADIDGYNHRQTVQKTHLKSKFDGIGPRAGADMAYMLGCGFSLIGRGSASLLVGDLKSFSYTQMPRFVESGDLVDGFFDEKFFAESKERVIIPAGHAKMALNYSFDCADCVMMLEGGWQWMGYFHSVRHRFVDLDNGVMQATSNFALHGPYLSLKLYA